MESGTTHLLTMLRERVDKLSAEGKWEDAIRASVTHVEKARESVSDGDLESLLQLSEALESRGDLLRTHGYLEEGRIAYLEALELLNGRIEFTESLARISCSIGVLYDMVENDQEAITFFTRAKELYERLGKEFIEPIADICNNLAFIYRALNHFDEAEKLFLRALQICHQKHGETHEKTALIYNNLAALYLASGKFDSAREMNTMALETRMEVLGRNHPDTAQSHSNLALTIFPMGDHKGAKMHFQKAFDIYERHIKTESNQYVAITENYVEFLRQIGDEKGSVNIHKRALKKLKKVAAH